MITVVNHAIRMNRFAVIKGTVIAAIIGLFFKPNEQHLRARAGDPQDRMCALYGGRSDLQRDVYPAAIFASVAIAYIGTRYPAGRVGQVVGN